MKKQFITLITIVVNFYVLSAQPLWDSSEPCTINPWCNGGTDVNTVQYAVALLFWDSNGDNIPEDKRTGVFISSVNSNRLFLLTAAHNVPASAEYIYLGNTYYNHKLILTGHNGCNLTNFAYTRSPKIRRIALVGDFLLLEVSRSTFYSIQSPIYALGWTINNDSPNNVISYHHPNADRLSVSFFTNAQQTIDSSDDVWQFDISDGFLQSGSSGGPVLDQNMRIIGLNWRYDGLSTPTCSNYKSLGFLSSDLSADWCALKPYLDPQNTGATATNMTIMHDGFTWQTNNTTFIKPTVKGDFNGICAGANKTYELENYPISDASISWNEPPSFSRTENFNFATYTASSSSIGDFEFKATLNHCGTTKEYKKMIWAGPPRNPYNLEIIGGNPSPFPCIPDYTQEYEVIVESLLRGTNTVTWGGSAYSIVKETNLKASFYPNANAAPYYGGGYISHTAYNACGSYTLSEGYGPCSYSYSTYPNPVNQTLYIEFKEPVITDTNSYELNSKSNFSFQNEAREIILYNDKKEKLKYLVSNDLKEEMDVSDLEKGFYFLHVNTSKSNEKSIVIIE